MSTKRIDIENVLDFFQDFLRPEASTPLLFTRRIGWSKDGKAAEGHSINRAPLHVGGRAFREGWGDHAQSELDLRFPSAAEAFEALVGVQDLITAKEPLKTAARIVFSIEDTDGHELASSPELRQGDAPYTLRATLGGAKRIFLRARDLRFPADTLECPGYAHAAWCEPVVSLANGATLRQPDIEVRASAPPVSMAYCRYNGHTFDFDEPETVERVESAPSFDRYRLEQTTPDGLLTVRVTATVYRDFPVIEWLPYDMFWVDAGWFGTDRPVAKDAFEGSDWWRTVGLWHVNRVVHPDGNRLATGGAGGAGKAGGTRKVGSSSSSSSEISRRGMEPLMHANVRE